MKRLLLGLAGAENLLDQQVRDIEIGKAHIGIGMVHRGKLDKPAPNSVAEHDQVYLMVRIDPDKVTPLKDEAASKNLPVQTSASGEVVLGPWALVLGPSTVLGPLQLMDLGPWTSRTD